MVKITDVAKRAGVAKSTVSNVLTGKKFVSEELKSKVLAACAEMDFHPNFYASGLSNKKTKIIALLLENKEELVSQSFYKDLIISCVAEASRLGYSLLVYYNADKEKLLNTLRQGIAPIDGAILMAPCVDDERLKQMESNRTNCVVIGRPDKTSGLSFVDVDNKLLVNTVAARLAEEYGEVYLINSAKNMTISQDRQTGFAEACQKFNIDAESHILETISSGENEGYELTKKILRKNIAVITANGRTAKGVYRAVSEAGLQVGADVGVFALGRSQAHGVFEPKLSYAVQDYTLLGQKAVDMLIDQIENGANDESMLVQSEIIFANSSQKSPK